MVHGGGKVGEVEALWFLPTHYPHLEEAYRFVELVMPLLPVARTGTAQQARGANTGLFGEPLGSAERSSALRALPS